MLDRVSGPARRQLSVLRVGVPLEWLGVNDRLGQRAPEADPVTGETEDPKRKRHGGTNDQAATENG